MTALPSGLPMAWLETAEYTLDASRAVLETENYSIACELAWGAAENALKASIFQKAEGRSLPDREYKLHRIPELYSKVTEHDSLRILDSVQEFNDYNEYVRYPKWKGSGEIEMPSEKYTETRAERAVVSAALILDAVHNHISQSVSSFI